MDRPKRVVRIAERLQQASDGVEAEFERLMLVAERVQISN